MRLNGWQRIGIVASVIWAVSAYLIALGGETWADSLYRLCTARAPAADGRLAHFVECQREHEKNLPEALALHQKQATLVALVPVPVGWAIVYVVVWVVRWIRRGFNPA